MRLITLLAVVVWCSLLNPAAAQESVAKSSKDASGLILNKVPESLYAHVPNLPAGQGLLVEKVQPDSAAGKAGVKRHDILLSLAGVQLKNIEQFTTLYLAEREQSPLKVLRSGKEMTLRLAREEDLPKGLLKPAGLPAVTIKAQPLDAHKMAVTVLYYGEGTGKLHQLNVSGSLPDIENQIKSQEMPARVHDLVDVALKRLRVLNDAGHK